MRVFLLIAAVTLAAPAFAETLAPSSPTAPVSKAKTDFTKPFIYDGMRQQSPPKQDRPHVELNAGSGPINR